MLKLLGPFLIGFAALAILAWSWAFWLPVAMQIGDEHGSTWRVVALATMGTATVAAAWGLWRVQDRLERRFDYRGGGQPESLFCQRCGARATASTVVCACGGTRFGIGRTGTRTGTPTAP